VQDIVSHVVGLEALLLGRPAPDDEPDWERLPHVRTDLARLTERDVDARRGRTPTEVLAELEEVAAARRAVLAREALDPAGPAPAFFGTVERMLALRPFDLWAHEQDIRRATGRPGNLDGAGAHATRERIELALPFVVGKQVAPPPGTTVVWQVTGALPFVSAVSVGDDGRGAPAEPRAEPTVRLAMDWETFVLLGCGRRPHAHLAVDVDGDQDLAQRVLAAMAVTP